MSQLQASNYKATATGYLPMLKSLDVPEIPGSAAASQTTTNLATTTCLLSAAGAVTFSPSVVPPIGAIKKFLQGAAFNATITPDPAKAIFVKGPNNVALATNVVLAALASGVVQTASYQYIGLTSAGLQQYRLIETNSTSSF